MITGASSGIGKECAEALIVACGWSRRLWRAVRLVWNRWLLRRGSSSATFKSRVALINVLFDNVGYAVYGSMDDT